MARNSVRPSIDLMSQAKRLDFTCSRESIVSKLIANKEFCRFPSLGKRNISLYKKQSKKIVCTAIRNLFKFRNSSIINSSHNQR